MGKMKIYDLRECVDADLQLKALTIYACEGYKTFGYIAGMANSLPSIVRCFVDYLIVINVPLTDIKIRVQMHDDLDIETVRQFWTTLIPEIRYVGERIRKTNSSKRKRIPYGIAHIEVCSKYLFDYIQKEVSSIFPPS